MKWSIFFLTSLLPTILLTDITDRSAVKKLRYEDATYEEEIRTVRLYPNSGNQSDVFLSPIERLGQNTLYLEFDDLVEEQEEYRVKIIHCNANWSKSKLRNLDFLIDFNEFNINTFNYSVDTKIGYVHYEFRLPPVKIPGNYLLVAYRGNDENDIILSKRFMVYQPRVDVDVLSNFGRAYFYQTP